MGWHAGRVGRSPVHAWREKWGERLLGAWVGQLLLGLDCFDCLGSGLVARGVKTFGDCGRLKFVEVYVQSFVLCSCADVLLVFGTRQYTMKQPKALLVLGTRQTPTVYPLWYTIGSRIVD